MRAILQTTTVCLVLAISAAAVAEDKMPWQPDLETAKRVAAQTNRLVLIHFWAPWCRPCMRMEQDVFSKPETAKGLEANFVLVKLNADNAPGTARLYGVSSLPSDVITLPNGRLVSQLQSPPTAGQYVQMMNRAGEGHRSLARKQTNEVSAVGAPTAAPMGDVAQPVGQTPGAPPAPPQAAPPAAAVAEATPTGQPPAGGDPYAEYFPEAQTAGPGAAGAVTPAQAYAPPAAPAAPVAQPPLTDPYAHPAPPAADPYAAAQQAPPSAGPAAANMPANPYAAPAAAQPPADPYAAQHAAGPQSPANPYAAAPQAPPANPYAAPQTPANPYAAPQTPANPYAAAPPPANPYAAQAPVAPATAMAPQPAAAYPPQAGLPQLPPGCPPLALDGNCPVTLVERKRWTVGHASFGAVHRGRTYLFLGPQERDKFLADPDRYSPVLSGLDPVQAIDSQQSVPGKREFGVFAADGKIYLFADDVSRNKFEQNEQLYTTKVAQMLGLPVYQAIRPTSP